MLDMTACAYNPRAWKVERDPQNLTGKPVWPNWQVPSSVRKPVLKKKYGSQSGKDCSIHISILHFTANMGSWENVCVQVLLIA